jgi:hypothetical protein
MRGKFTENRDEMRVKFAVNRGYIPGKFAENHRKLRGAPAENRVKVRSVALERTFPFSLCEMITLSVHLFQRSEASFFKKLTDDVNYDQTSSPTHFSDDNKGPFRNPHFLTPGDRSTSARDG